MSVKRRWTKQPWEPAPSFKALFGEKSGNRINGRGEAKRRKPQRIFWLVPSNKGPFSELQDTVVNRHNSVAELHEVYANAQRGPRLSDPAPVKVRKSAVQWAAEAKAFALAHEADQVGVAAIDPLWIYEGFEKELFYVIVMLVAMDHTRSAELPSTVEDPSWVQEVAVQYNRGARTARHTAQWIRGMGYNAKPHAGPWIGSLNLIPAAIAAGLGELGKHGSMINREYGSSFRLAAVETDMPLQVDGPDVFGGDDFCLRCQVCTKACPPQAISSNKGLVRGEVKWYVDFDKCIGYFNETFGCAICIAVCPWSTPGLAPRMAEKFSNLAGKTR